MVRYPHTGTIKGMPTERTYDPNTGENITEPVMEETMCRVELSAGKNLSGVAYIPRLTNEVLLNNLDTFVFQGREYQIVTSVNFQQHTVIWLS